VRNGVWIRTFGKTDGVCGDSGRKPFCDVIDLKSSGRNTGIYSWGVPCVLGYNISLPRTSAGHICHSHSTLVMSSSRMRSLATYLNGPFSSISAALELSASLAEKIMLLKVLTSMFSAISDESSGPDDLTFLMSMAATQTLCHLEVVQSSVGTMQSRMETLLQEGWGGRAQVDFLRLRISGARLSAQKVGTSFSDLYKNWTQSLSSSDTANFSTTPTGTTPKSENPMWVPMVSNLTLEWYLTWLHGEESLLEMIQ